ncbi:Zn-ribbon domain-containing OB-fold protein [Natrarchaeobaculum sulfurireducens]|uniref:OB-fold domain and Zn-ribbon containing protein n=1 Tax=Natrarchaeobaculum sulfurireducens TaxID=2044521 RepID=A0A346PUC7_9EURY|nr:OB-fold domain-containing protein [Natrarchaeobaculum sulfurireducens]AXR79351.1 OB-fold domain and Zn-ribbon containing protein [Natrarchaeobaculum sulfurireducens]AXR83122.1 hypothetical protein AArcMg_3136 [Natrarchaeobaculum sulfurireducens]
MSVERVLQADYDSWLDALEEGDGYYLRTDGEATIPPLVTGDADLERVPLARTGTVDSKTVIRVPHPDFGEDAPYVVALASFGPVTLTGQVTGIDPEAVETGLEVEPTVLESGTDAERFVGFTPVDGQEVTDE